MKSLELLPVNDSKVIVRLDLNVPIQNGQITDDNRILAVKPTLEYLIKNNAKVIIMSHLGRIKSEDDKAKHSLKPVADRLSEVMNQPVHFVNDTRGETLESAIDALKGGDLLMMENTRFEDANGKKESGNDSDLAKYWASLADAFVNDAFGTLHRAHASNVGIASHIEHKAPGYLIQKELDVFNDALNHPKRPFVAILGGAKVSDKIGVIQNLLSIADKVIVAGGMSYTFLKAQGYEIGTSLVEDDKLDLASSLMKEAKGKLEFAVDYKLTKAFDNEADVRIADYDDFNADEMGLDIGPKSLEKFKSILDDAGQVIWNGPVGVFEMSNFAQGTEGICEVLASLNDATTIIGGGDSAAAAIQMGFKDSFTHISTGGGASLEFLEGKTLPGLQALK